MKGFEKLAALYQRYIDNDLSKEELHEFLLMLHQHEYEQELDRKMDLTWEEMFPEVQQARIVPFNKRTWFKRLAAASVVLLLGTAAWFLFFPTEKEKPPPSSQSVRFGKDILPPSGNKAILTLADGRKIVLDSARNGALAKQDQVNVLKQNDNKIVYTSGETNGQPVKYNTLTVPRGSKPVQLLLADGSGVWLNVASSITYPTAFTGNERKVTITGEVYFEVASLNREGQAKKMPFIVKIMTPAGPAGEVEVLGTQFNINAYDDEPVMRTTLLEGSIKLTSRPASPGGSRDSAILRPGMQAEWDRQGPITLVQHADLEEVMAWKNGLFRFKDANIETIMRQLEKWYDIEVDYKGNPPVHPFVAKIPRDVSVSELLKLLELTELVQFSIQGKKITVMP